MRLAHYLHAIIVVVVLLCTPGMMLGIAQTSLEESPYDLPAELFKNTTPLPSRFLESPPVSPIVSDDFSSPVLNTSVWTFINPSPVSTLSLTGTGTEDARLSIAVPAGTPHDAWIGGNNTARIMQATTDSDFEVEVKFESVLNARFQLQGIIVEQNANNYSRFDFYRTATETRVHAATIVNGTPTTRYNVVIGSGNPLFMRVRRTGNQWLQTFSYDGSTWFAAAAFSHTLTVSSIGPFVGNAGSPAPAFTGLIDYFFNTAAPIIPEDPIPSSQWWDNNRRFRLPMEITPDGFQRVNKPAEMDVNFTQLLTALGQTGSFDEHSLRVVETTSTGGILDTNVVFQFDKANGYHAATNARGTVVLMLGGLTPSTTSRFFHIYFETTGGSFSLPAFPNQVTVTDNISHQGQATIKIETPKSTYYYHKLGGGFATLEDEQGNDWIGYNETPGSAGTFRGIPNLGDVFHPGYTNSTSSIVSTGPLKTRILSTSIDGNWEGYWDIYPDYASMTLTRRGSNYWFLYEGTPGGSLNLAADYTVRSSGARTPLSTAWSGDLQGPEWVYFGDGGMNRMLYVVNHAEDAHPDYYRHMDGNMTVFGFGRQDPCCTRYLTAVPGKFTIGLWNDTTFTGASSAINSAYRPLVVTPGVVETNITSAIPPFITTQPENQSVIAGQVALFAVTAAGTAPFSYQWLKNGAIIPGATNSFYITPATILADNGALFQCVVTNQAGSTTSNAALLTVTMPPGAPVSDDFNTVGLDGTLWTFVNPLNDATLAITGAGTQNARLSISVPGGIAHDVWTTGINAPRIMQPVANSDFEVEVKFEALMSAQYQTQGILVQQDNGNLLRFDFVRNSNRTRLFAASFVNGVPTVRKDTTIAHGNPLYLRVGRQGNTWTQRFSYNGQTWVTGAVFTHTLTVGSIGPFFGNAGSPPPPFTGLVDYFFNTSSPIVPEDGGPPRDPNPPVISNVSVASQQNSFQVTWTTDEPATGIIEYGRTLIYELGTVQHSDLRLSHMLQVTGLDAGTTYNFRIRSSDAAGNERVSAGFSTTTLQPTAPAITLWYGKNQSFGHLGNPVPDVNILGNVSDPEGILALSYSLNGGPQTSLSIGPDTRRLSRKGDFNIDIPYLALQSGNNQVVITAVDSLSSTARETVLVNYTPGNTWPDLYNVDWSSAQSIHHVAQPVDGLWGIESGMLRPLQPGYDRFVAIGDRQWTNYEVTVPITILGIDSSGFRSPSNGAGVGLLMRWNGHTNSPAPVAGWQPKTGFLPLGALGWYNWNMQGQQRLMILGNNAQTLVADTSGRTLTFNTPYMFKMRAETIPGTGVRYSMKVWPQTDSEPTDWDIVGIDAPSSPGQGSVMLTAHHVDARFGNVTVTPLLDSPKILTVSVIGNGTIMRNPNQGSYATGDTVTLTAVPASGWQFDGWTGDLGGSANPATIVMTENKNVSATFVPSAVPPIISNVRLSVTSTHTTVRWTTNEASTSNVSYGPTAAYENGTVSNASLTTNHQIILAGLTPGMTYHFSITSANGNNVAASTGDSTFATASPSTLISDDFNSFGLNPTLWSFVNPLNDGTFAMTNTNTENAAVSITVPAGAVHEMWTNGIQAPHILQQANNADFEIEVKYLNGVSQQFQEQGILIKQDDSNYLRLEFYSDGSNTRLFAGSVSGSTGTARINTTIAPNNSSPLYMRIARTGDTWTQRYSLNGTTWTAGATFSHTLMVSGVGLYAGNAGTTPPALTTSVDYFINTASPVDPEDGGTPVDTLPPVITSINIATTSSGATISWVTDELATGVVSYGLTPGYEIGSVGPSALSTQHSMVLTGLQPAQTYHFRVSASDSAGNTSHTQDATFTTSTAASTIVSDDFNADTLNTSLWTFVNPVGDASYQLAGTGTENAWLMVNVPGGVSHDVWSTGINAPRIMQAASDTDFEVEVKYESGVSQRFQIQGVLVQQDLQNLLRFDFNSDGTATRLFAASFVNGVPTARINSAVLPNGVAPLYMRVKRQANLWSVSYSTNGSAWTQSVSFNHPIAVNSVGAFVGNSGTTIPAHTGHLDYFFNTASPIVPEDGGLATQPAIATHPVDADVAPGQVALFTVEATGTPAPTLQWQKNGVDIAGAIGASYQTTPATLGDSGATFRVRATNILGSVYSSSAVLRVYVPTSIITQPGNQTVAEGAPVTFSVAAGGSHPLSYQWQRNGEDIPGATFGAYTIPNVTMADSGALYRVVVSNPVGSITSANARLTVRIPPSIVTQPADRYAANGATATFSIVASGSSPLAYQWLRNGNTIPGANSANYTTPIVSQTDSGDVFTCTVSNNVGSVTSQGATLHVQSLHVITSPPEDQLVAVGGSATFSVVAEGAGPFAYQWQRDGENIEGANLSTYITPPATMSDSGATFRCRVTSPVATVTSTSAILHVMIPPTITTHPQNRFVALGQTAQFSVGMTGSFPFTFQWQKNGEDIPGAVFLFHTTPPTTLADSGALYRVRVSNAVGSVYSNTAMLEVAVQPTIIAQPANQIATAGGSATFSIEVTGTPELFYQWQRNGVDIPGATTSSYTLHSVATSDSGATFRCKVWNWVRLVTSESAQLTVTPPAIVRVTQNLQALYTFNEGIGTTVNDVSGVGSPLNLTIGKASAVTWFPGYLRINSSTSLLSPAAATKVISAATSTNQITLEAWVKPANTSQSGPAHIVAIPNNKDNRNALLGQTSARYEARIRTSATSNAGAALSSPNNTATTALSHVVYTRDAAGATRLYINGILQTSGTTTGTFSNWTTTNRLSIANEPGGGRPWLGELHLVAIYNRALTQAEVTQNFSAGAQPTALPPALATPSGNPSEIPDEYQLYQNYPNPFNPVTTIRYAVPEENMVTLKVYNILGQEVATLVDTRHGPGIYEVMMDGTDLASGTYIYRLRSGDYTAVRKFILMK